MLSDEGPLRKGASRKDNEMDALNRVWHSFCGCGAPVQTCSEAHPSIPTIILTILHYREVIIGEVRLCATDNVDNQNVGPFHIDVSTVILIPDFEFQVIF